MKCCAEEAEMLYKLETKHIERGVWMLALELYKAQHTNIKVYCSKYGTLYNAS